MIYTGNGVPRYHIPVCCAQVEVSEEFVFLYGVAGDFIASLGRRTQGESTCGLRLREQSARVIDVKFGILMMGGHIVMPGRMKNRQGRHDFACCPVSLCVPASGLIRGPDSDAVREVPRGAEGRGAARPRKLSAILDYLRLWCGRFSSWRCGRRGRRRAEGRGASWLGTLSCRMCALANAIAARDFAWRVSRNTSVYTWSGSRVIRGWYWGIPHRTQLGMGGWCWMRFADELCGKNAPLTPGLLWRDWGHAYWWRM